MSIARRSFLKILPAAGVVAGCSSSKPSKIRLALNWKPDPEFGGFYAADFAKHGLDVEILPGGAGTPTVQMIGAGSAEFGIVSADEILLARAQGNDVVALFAAFQNNPMGIMAHASRKLKSIEDVLKGGKLAIQSGLPYVRLLKKKFSLDKVKVVPSPGGDLTAFLNDEMFAQQCFLMEEPLHAKRKGVEVTVFPVSDIGYNPYTTVLGDLRYSATRINLAQSCNGIGWIFGPIVGSMFFYGTDAVGKSTGSQTLYIPYVAIAVVVVVLAAVF